MPITGPASYIPTTEAFLNHWEAVNAALPPESPLVIPGAAVSSSVPMTRAVFQGLYDTLAAQHSTVQTAITNDDLAREDLFDQKTMLLDKLNQFNDKVRGLLPETKWERRLPEVPSIGDGRMGFTKPMETAVTLWGRINDDGAIGENVALVLLGEYLQGDFESDVEELRTAYKRSARKEEMLAIEREERNDVQKTIHPVLRQYRALMPTFFAPANALVATLPLLTPIGGRTPDPVAATGSWDAATQKAKIDWPASADPDLDHYELRWSPGTTTYYTDDESTLARIAANAARSIESNHGLAESGDTSLFRLYVVLKSGHEAGSNTVMVTRP